MSEDTDLVALAESLKTLPEDLKQKALTELKTVADEAAALAKMFVRVDTGALRDSIHTEQVGDSVLIKAGGPTAPHAPIIEVKYPYLAPAVEAIKPQIDAVLARTQQEALDRVTNTK